MQFLCYVEAYENRETVMGFSPGLSFVNTTFKHCGELCLFMCGIPRGVRSRKARAASGI